MSSLKAKACIELRKLNAALSSDNRADEIEDVDWNTNCVQDGLEGNGEEKELYESTYKHQNNNRETTLRMSKLEEHHEPVK